MHFPKSTVPKQPDAPVPAPAPVTGTDVTGKFDPTLLERGAKALRDIDSSKNASKAFETIKLQEQTKQKELTLQAEQISAQRVQAGLQKTAMEAEEKRKTIGYQQQEERKSQQYKAQLDSELYQKKLGEQQKQNEELLAQQHEQFMRHEELRKQNEMDLEAKKLRMMQEQAKLQRENDAARVDAEYTAKTKQERENVDIRLREMRATKAEDFKVKIESIQTVMSNLGTGFNALIHDREKLLYTVGAMTALALGVYTAKNSTRVVGNLVEKKFGKPPLIRETSRRNWMTGRGFFAPKVDSTKMLDDIVLHKELTERLQWTSNALVQTKKNGVPFRHMLLYGPPGTGKTLFAQTLSKMSGLDYAIMSGGDVGPLGKDAVTEVNKLFAWAKQSKKGMILFIDEADAFLRHGRAGDGMTEETRQVLSTFLAHTGTEQENFCIIMATNVKEVIDRAVMDRIDERFELPLPGKSERRTMLDLFIARHLLPANKAGFTIKMDDEVLSDEYLDEVAGRTAGFSGRQMAKLVLAMQAAVYGSGPQTVLTRALSDTIINWKLAHFDEDSEATQLGQASKLKAEEAA